MGLIEPMRVEIRGMSMYRVLTPGERLEVQEIAPEQLVCGDVAVVTHQDRQNIVHRVIRVSDDELQTMGDNTAQADPPVKFNGNHRFFLVTGAINSRGEFRKIINGEAGMMQFRRNQRKMKIRRFFGRILWAFESLFFWRRTAGELCKFGKEEVYYYKNIPVARRNQDGRIIYLKWTRRLWYKVKDNHAE